LDIGTEYWGRVALVNSEGQSDWSNVDSAVPVTAPSAPAFGGVVRDARVYEVQSVSSVAAHVDEVQVISTTIHHVAEVQTVQTSGPYDHTLTGTFTLSFNSVSTSPLAHDASADDVRDELLALPDVNAVEVIRSLATAEGGYMWTITLQDVVQVAYDSPVPMLACDATDLDADLLGVSTAADCTVTRDIAKSAVGGSFYAVMGARSSPAISASADAAAV
jgi:hypothetical protein